jgi:integrase
MQIHVNGQRIRRIFPDQSSAEDELERLRVEQKAGRDLLAKQPTLTAWRKICQAEHFGHLRPNVREDYDSVGKNRIDGAPLGKTRLDKLTDVACQKWLDTIAASGLSYFTVRNARALLRRVMGIAKKKRLIAVNPAAELTISLPAVPDDDRPVEHTWTMEEATSFLAIIKGHRQEALFYLALTIGARLGEICGLCWSDIDLKSGTIFIRKQLQRIPESPGSTKKKWSLEPVKTTASTRKLRADAYGLQLLRERQSTQNEERQLPGFAARDPFADKGGLVFTSELGGPIHGSSLTAIFNRLIRKAGVPVIRFHDQRHTCASLMLAAKEAVTTVSAVLGHKSPAITMQFYAHAIRGQADEAIARHAERLRREQ